MKQIFNSKEPAHGMNANLAAAFVLLILAIFCIFFFTLVIKEHILYSTIKSSGVKINGTVTYTHSSHRNKTTLFFINYEYIAPDGSQLSDTAQTNEVSYHHFSKGQQFALYILPSNPKLNKPEFTSPPSSIILILIVFFLVFSLSGSIFFFFKSFRSMSFKRMN